MNHDLAAAGSDLPADHLGLGVAAMTPVQLAADLHHRVGRETATEADQEPRRFDTVDVHEPGVNLRERRGPRRLPPVGLRLAIIGWGITTPTPAGGVIA